MEEKGATKELRERLSKILDVNTPNEEVIGAYDDWAETYDKDQLQHGYGAPFLASDVLRDMVPDKNAYILDAAAGTGLGGEELKKHGYNNQDALDPSKNLLAIAEQRQVYKRTICDKLGTNRLDIDPDYYDAVTCAGCFVPGHVPPDCLPELVRIVKPGGYIIIITREQYYNDADYGVTLRKAIQGLVDADQVTEIKRELRPGYYKDLKTAFVIILQVLCQSSI
ncbi:uncharacterized protein LOC144443671 [Glandiceps talaboti]